MTSFSLSTFRDFCAAKPEGERYNFYDVEFDPMGQFMRSVERAPQKSYWGAEAIPYGLSSLTPWTYGALTARLDALIEGEKK